MSVPIDPARLKDPAYLGRVISMLEQNPDQALEFTSTPHPVNPNTQRIGFTGSPGVGKSTLIAAVISELVAQGHQVGVIAVDPTSAFSGGAVLGDRLRLASPDHDGSVFIRSMASRGSLGGVSPAAGKITEVLAFAGYNRILIETVGVGQLGYDIISLADTVVAMFSPESGDAVQFLKAGLTEFGDIFAVNKADRPGADLVCKELRLGLDLDQNVGLSVPHHGLVQLDSPGLEGAGGAQAWETPVLQLIAKDATGVDLLVASIESHRLWHSALPADSGRKIARLSRELMFRLGSEVSWLVGQNAPGLLEDCAQKIAAGNLAQEAAIQMLKSALKGWL